MNLTFREKSLRLMLISLAATFGYYFPRFFPYQTDTTQSDLMHLMFIVIVLVVIDYW